VSRGTRFPWSPLRTWRVIAVGGGRAREHDNNETIEKREPVEFAWPRNSETVVSFFHAQAEEKQGSDASFDRP